MPNLHYRGRLGERWRILLDETNTGWHASLLDRLDSATSDLGDYEHFGQAKRESAAKARQVLADRNLEDPGPVLDWQKIPQLVTLEPDGSFRRWAGILSGLIGALSLGVTIVLALTGTGNRSAHDDTEAIRAQVEDLRRSVARLSAVQPSSPPPAMASLQADLAAIKQKVSALDVILGSADDPIQRLTVPMLRRDLESLQEKEKSDYAQLKEETTRTLDFLKLIASLIGIGGIGGAVASWFRPAAPKP